VINAQNKKIVGRISFRILLFGFILVTSAVILPAAKVQEIRLLQLVAVISGALLMAAGSIGVILYDSE